MIMGMYNTEGVQEWKDTLISLKVLGREGEDLRQYGWKLGRSQKLEITSKVALNWNT